jgi:CRP-like cAMP-binding protein
MKNLSFNELFAQTTTENRYLERGELLFEQGDPATHIYAVQEGCVKLIRYTEEGSAVCMHTAYAGESFAEAALFSEIFHCDAEAVLPSTVCCYPKDEIFAILAGYPERANKFIALLAGQVRSLRTLLEVRSIRNAKERIMQFLLLRANPQSNEVVQKGTYKDMARELDLAHETFYRSLTKLEKEGKIQRTPSAIKIIKSSLV